MKKLKFKKIVNRLLLMVVTVSFLGLMSCGDDDDMNIAMETGTSDSFDLDAVGSSNVSGTITFNELEDASIKIVVTLNGTAEGGSHPAHIHDNSAAEGGGIAVSLTPIDGATGISETVVTAKDDGTPITYTELINYDGYVNVHLSAEDLGTIVAQGDIGENVLTGESIIYDLGSVAVADISGTATFYERINGEALAVLMLNNTPAGGSHPAHIHANSAAEGGGILFSFNAVDGTSGMSKTNVAAYNDGSALTYSAFETLDSYINVHLSAEALGTIVAQGDIGQNDLTGESIAYDLGAVAVADISGTATFYERINGEALAVLTLVNTPAGGSHPAHIHANSAAEGGGILFSFNAVDGTTGMSKTNVAAYNDGSALTYSAFETLDSYINVHLSAEALGTIVAQGDIGQNDLTGESIEYRLAAVAVADISGTATFYERINGEALAVLRLVNTPAGGSHPAHIHANSAAVGGGILFTFNAVDGTTGMSKTNVAAYDDDSSLGYDVIESIDGYINVHLSAAELGTIVAQGNIGINAGTSSGNANYNVTNSGSSAYIFNGEDLTNSQNPSITLTRGETYTFTVDSPGHPFLIKTAQSTGTGSTYDDGVNNNGTASGTVTFTVPTNAPNSLFYICQFHSSMTGEITIVD
jgi:hypothetical protein